VLDFPGVINSPRTWHWHRHRVLASGTGIGTGIKHRHQAPAPVSVPGRYRSHGRANRPCGARVSVWVMDREVKGKALRIEKARGE